MLERLVGKFFCWLGFHAWYNGTTRRYCDRCDAVERLDWED